MYQEVWLQVLLFHQSVASIFCSFKRKTRLCHRICSPSYKLDMVQDQMKKSQVIQSVQMNSGQVLVPTEQWLLTQTRSNKSKKRWILMIKWKWLMSIWALTVQYHPTLTEIPLKQPSAKNYQIHKCTMANWKHKWSETRTTHWGLVKSNV